MKQKCSNCLYYHGKQGVHCGLHPYGRPDRYCPDWAKLPWATRFDRFIKQLKKLKLVDWLCFSVVLISPGGFTTWGLYRLKILDIAHFTQSASLTYAIMALVYGLFALASNDDPAKVVAIGNFAIATILAVCAIAF